MQMSIGFGGQRRRAVRTAAEPGAPSGGGRDFVRIRSQSPCGLLGRMAKK
jgi:hypothetical protein